MKCRAHVIISGRVQGVGFRYHTVRQAAKLGLTGWVRNQPDGRVEVMIEGEEQDVQQMLVWCTHGPAFAKVSSIDTNTTKYMGEFSDFNIL